MRIIVNLAIMHFPLGSTNSVCRPPLWTLQCHARFPKDTPESPHEPKTLSQKLPGEPPRAFKDL